MKGCALAAPIGMCVVAWVISRNPYIHPLAVLLMLTAGAFVGFMLFGPEERTTKASRRWHEEHFKEWERKD